MLQHHTGAHKSEKGKPGSYRGICLALSLGAATALLLPWVFIELRPPVPLELDRCVSLRWLGRPCPLCGLTRGLHAIWHGDFTGATRLNPISVPVATLLLLELVVRVVFLRTGFAASASPRFRSLDFRVHMAIAAAYLVYALVFMARTWLVDL
jgi:hypothetical protein